MLLCKKVILSPTLCNLAFSLATSSAAGEISKAVICACGKSFASDNYSGIHPDVLKAIGDANLGHQPSYGEDIYTTEAVEKFKKIFGENINVFFVLNGTGANTLAMKAITLSHNSVICAETSHMNIDECGAPENFTGCKLITIKTENGKLTPDLIKPYLIGFGDQHHSQPKAISITQSTEMGTIYQPDEIKAIAELAHNYNLLFHMDGARISNAAASLRTGLKELTVDLGVDILSFGGTKNGLMIGEAIIFFKKELAENFLYIRKQGMQLISKMRYISVQFNALLSNELWRKNASKANNMATMLYRELCDIPEIIITQKVEANTILAIIDPKFIKPLQEKYFFYIWNEETNEVRFMTSFDTTTNDIKYFIKYLKKVILDHSEKE